LRIISTEKDSTSGSTKNSVTEISTDKTEASISSDDTSAVTTKAVETKKPEDAKTEKPDAKQEVKEATSEVKDAIKDKLDVSDEQIEEAMLALGMSITDLLDPQKVTDLVATLSGSEDTLSFLTDADMMSNLNDILSVVETVNENLADVLQVEPVELSDVVATVEFSDDERAVFFQEDKGVAKEVKPEETESAKEETSFSDELSDVIARKTVVTSQETAGQESKSGKDMSQGKGSETTFDNVVNNLTDSVRETFSEIVTDSANMVSEADILRQVIDQVKVTANATLQSIEVILNPENLGSVHVTVSAKEGVITAQLTAENEQVKAALENQVIALKEHFNSQGMKVEAVEVTIESHSFESNENLQGNDSNQAKEERKTSGKLDFSSLDDLDDEELTASEIRARDAIVNGDSSVEYTA